MVKVHAKKEEVWDFINAPPTPQPDANGDFDCVHYPFSTPIVVIQGAPPGGVAPYSVFVLLHPQLTVKSISKWLSVLKEWQVACGYNVADAIAHRHVLVIGPVPDLDLLPLQQGGSDVKRVTGNTDEKIKKDLQKKLQEVY